MIKYLLTNFKYVVCIIAIIFVGLYIRDLLQKNEDLYQNLIKTKENFKLLTEHSANLERRYVNQKELLELTKKEFSKEVSSLRGQVKVLSNATFLIRENARRSGSSDIQYSGNRIKFVFNELRFEKGPPVGYIIIFDDGRIVSKLYDHEISVKSVITKDYKSGRYDVVSRADFILKSDHAKKEDGIWTNKPFPIKISGGVAHIDPSEPSQSKKSFHLWNPKLNLNTNLDGSSINPGLGISLMSYGENKFDSDWKFLQFGIQSKYSKVEPTFTLALWRPWKEYLPNTYIGTGVSLENTNKYHIGLSIGF